MTVSSRSAKRAPPSTGCRREPLRHRTAVRSARLAALLVGSTPVRVHEGPQGGSEPVQRPAQGGSEIGPGDAGVKQGLEGVLDGLHLGEEPGAVEVVRAELVPHREQTRTSASAPSRPPGRPCRGRPVRRSPVCGAPSSSGGTPRPARRRHP